MNKERKLSKAESRRLSEFNELKKNYIEQRYEFKDLTISASKANIIGPLYGLLLSIPFIVVSVLLSGVDMFIAKENYLTNDLIFIVLLFVFILVHEMLHGLGWLFSVKNGLKSIEFGVNWKSLNPYCTCKEPLNRKQYIIGLMLPCIVLGFIPCIISFFNHNAWYLMMGVVMILSAGGDLMILKTILNDRISENELYVDHPTDIGLVKFVK